MESYCNNMNSCNTRPMRSGRNISSNCNYGRRTIQDSNHRHMEVECVCRMTPGKNCHKEDSMMQLGNAFPPVMAYVPWQKWRKINALCDGLSQGTIFKELSLPFYGCIPNSFCNNKGGTR